MLLRCRTCSEQWLLALHEKSPGWPHLFDKILKDTAHGHPYFFKCHHISDMQLVLRTTSLRVGENLKNFQVLYDHGFWTIAMFWQVKFRKTKSKRSLQQTLLGWRKELKWLSWNTQPITYLLTNHHLLSVWLRQIT